MHLKLWPMTLSIKKSPQHKREADRAFGPENGKAIVGL